jgi:hypothetical protein
MSNHISQAIEQLEYAENTNCINNPEETKTELLRSQSHALITIAQQLQIANLLKADELGYHQAPATLSGSCYPQPAYTYPQRKEKQVEPPEFTPVIAEILGIGANS